MAYWPIFYHDNKVVELNHLEPFDLQVETPSGALRDVHVRFSAHTFTRGATDADPLDQRCFDSRIFSSERYELSKELTSIIHTWPMRRVFQTWERRSYVYLAIVEMGDDGGIYHIFFGLKRSGQRVDLTIESAYRKEPSSYTPPKKPDPIRFSLLVEKVFQGQPLRFK